VLSVEYTGEIADYDTRILTLSLLKGFFDRVSDDPVSFVNAPQVARERGIEVRESSSSTSHDFVNLITVRAGDRAIAGTLSGLHGDPRIVLVDDHKVDVPPARHMLIVRNEDVPGVIGVVGTVLGEAGVNIADMDVGQTADGTAAMMVLATGEAVGEDVLERLLGAGPIRSVHPISLRA